MELTRNEEWGNPLDRYDITITKAEEKDRVKYTVIPSPPSKTSEEIRQALGEKTIDLKALFYGADPFDKDWKATVEVLAGNEAEDVFGE